MKIQLKWIPSFLTILCVILAGSNISVAQAQAELTAAPTATSTDTAVISETATLLPSTTPIPSLTATPLPISTSTSSVNSAQLQALPSGVLLPGNYNEDFSSITYTRKWVAKVNSSATGGSHKRTVIYGQTASFTFYGNQLIVFHTQTRDSGVFRISIDGTNYKFNAQKSKTQYQAQWKSPVLTSGLHTVVIEKHKKDKKPIFLDGLGILDSTSGPAQAPTVVATFSPTPLPTQLPTLQPTQTLMLEPTYTFVPTATWTETSTIVVPSTSTQTPALAPTNTPTPIPPVASTPTATLTSVPTTTQVISQTATPTNTLLPTNVVTSTSISTSIPPTATATPTVSVPISGQVWYVDNLATGNNTGTSWQNAWKSFNDINFGAIGSGDTLYISGGNTSKTYTGTLRVPAGTTGITITKGVDAGHNSEVIFDGGNSTQYGVSINAERTPVKNLTISNLTFRNYTGAGVYGSGQNSGGLQGITVDNCKFLNFNRAGVFFEGNNNLNNNYNVAVKNSYFDDNNAGTGQSDGIYVQVLKDFTADHNYIILDNNYTGVADVHSDNIQSFWVDNVMYSNNLVVQKSNKTLGTQMLFTENGYGEHVFLNNVLIRDTPYAADSAMRLKSTNGPTFMAKVIGNTYYGKGRILNSSTETIIKNNIFYGISQPTSDRPIYITSSGSNVSNNIFYDPNYQFPSTSGGIDVNPMFVSTDFNAIDLHLQSSSPAINAGANLGSQYIVDIEGKSRGLVWDIGAYESSNP